jgi:hypothetical protein
VHGRDRLGPTVEGMPRRKTSRAARRRSDRATVVATVPSRYGERRGLHQLRHPALPASERPGTRRGVSVSVYTVANARFYPGLVALVSSLRVQGHRGPIVVVDTGLTPSQIESLTDTTIIAATPDRSAHYAYAKPFGPMERPDDVMLLVDADMLCVRPLDDIVDLARSGSIVAIEDIGRPGLTERTWRQWAEHLQLGTLEPRTYVNGGFLALPRDLGVAFFAEFVECVARVDPSETHVGATEVDFDRPFFILDQDIFNALLASSKFAPSAVTLPYGCAPHAPFRGVRIDGELTCVSGDGVRPYLLHHALQKPWLEPLPTNAYTELMVTCLHHPAAPAVNDRELPRFLRAGRAARAARMLRSTRGRARAHLRGRLGLRPYLERRASAVRGRIATLRSTPTA